MTHVKEQFPYAKILGTDRVLGGTELDRCRFEGGVLAQDTDPACGLVVRDLVMRGCRTTGPAEFHGVTFDGVTVDGLSHGGPLVLNACLLRHVTFRGKIGVIGGGPASTAHPEAVRQAFADAAAAFYAQTDWALDITEAELAGASLSQIPGHLVRRDPETQFLVHRARASAVDSRTLPMAAEIAVELAKLSPYETMVAVAPKRSKRFAAALEELTVLRDLRIAE
ncbi:hypothetical protein [Phytomonospora endophytica]|uniref:Uncharacterized protein n=1 Tax=Phytomonospora endophytica TaxID=714109 RepID=A0A841G039_9ACTN|nr:hypothetical protein [Phytomonospora endophytica]MBB6039142.1 hypothetical protein [Phytomonospora endophytica]GIG67621.1 hypothetical protein Pen01_39160 [Phytomonospora endophytica]